MSITAPNSRRSDTTRRRAELQASTAPPAVTSRRLRCFRRIAICGSALLTAAVVAALPVYLRPQIDHFIMPTRSSSWADTARTATPWQRRSIFARGEGGFGGERGPSTSSEPPDRAPDLELDIPTLPQQALLYRLCGDRNPLHSDPEFAAAAGFPRPILHGLCTYGMTCKAMVDALLDGDTARVGSYGARFAGVVFPGETLKANVWKEGDGFRAIVTAPERDDAVALGRSGAGPGFAVAPSRRRRNAVSYRAASHLA